MATTIDDTVYINFPITKTEETADGNILVYGKATDPSIDSDEQIVDADWSAKAIEDWLSTGPNLRVQHNPHRDPAGVGISADLDRDGDGGHWVKALVVEPTAKDLVRAKALRAYSVGIMHPKIVTDPKARGGRIVGGELGEISLVDRPANRNCGITLVKAAKDGSAEEVELVFGDTTKAMSPSFSPNDLAEVFKKKKTKSSDSSDSTGNPEDEPGEAVDDETTGGGSDGPDVADGDPKKKPPGGSGTKSEVHLTTGSVAERLAEALKHESTTVNLNVSGSILNEKDLADAIRGVSSKGMLKPDVTDKRRMDPNVGGGVDRDKIPGKDFAGRNRSFPIVTPGDVGDAASSIGRAGADNYSSDKLKRRIISIARRKGPQFVNALPDAWKSGFSTEEETMTKGTKMTCDKCGMKISKGAKFCKNCGAKTSDMNGATVDIGKHSPGDGVQAKDTETVPGHREPDGAAMEIFEEDADLTDGDEKKEGDAEPTPNWPAHPRPHTGRASKNVASYELARLHDATCAAYSQETVTATYPTLKGVGDAVDYPAWQSEAMRVTATGDLDAAQVAIRVATAAKMLSSINPAAVADAHAALHKSYAELNPGVGSAISPTNMTPGQFRRPYIIAGHAPLSIQPNMSQPPPATAHYVTAEDFTRADLASQGVGDHAAASPGNKAGNSPSHGGAPAYAAAQVAIAGNALKELHDHIAARYERLCPMDLATHTATNAAGPGDAGVMHPDVAKAASVDVDAPTDATAALVEKMVNERLAERDETITELRSRLDELAGSADPSMAPMRGISSSKSSTSGGGVVERRSLIDEAVMAEHLDKISYVKNLTKSGNPMLADQARTELERLEHLDINQDIPAQ